MCCDLEVDVNGQETFFVDKRILSSFSGRLDKLFGKLANTPGNLKVIFHDLPGGSEGFELVSRFCYSSGSGDINPSNISLLYSVAHFLEMTEGISGTLNLIEQTEKYLEGISYWTWSDLMVALKQCQDLMLTANSSGVLRRCLNSLIARVGTTTDTSPSTSSPDSSVYRFSCDTRSSESLKNSYTNGTCWFEDLVLLSPDFIEEVIKGLILQKFDHATISKFLFYYQRSRFISATADEKCKIIEKMVDLLFSLDGGSVSCKSLFGILRVAMILNVSKCCRNQLESMIGSQMDQATLDNLLIPSPRGAEYLYDVNLILRFLKSFLNGGSFRVSSVRLKKVARLIDLYIAEVAPDNSLKPSKFVALAMALPDSARDSYDGMYQALDMYLEVHSGLSEEEKTKVCCVLNYEKLSSEACKHLSQNARFPSKTAVQALTSQQIKLKSLIQDRAHPISLGYSSCNHSRKGSKGNKDDESEQIVLYAKKLELSTENEKLRTHMRGMQGRVMELEEACRKMQTQMAKIMKSKLSTPSNTGFLPKLCS